MAMTKEERKAKKRERENKFPYGAIGYNGLWVSIKSCEGSVITVTIPRGQIEEFGYVLHASVPPSIATVEYHFDLALTDLEALAEFIHALACRYNAIVDEANAIAAASGLKQLKKIPETIIEETQPMFT